VTSIAGLRAPLAIAAVLWLVAAAGCREPRSQVQLQPGERYARRFLPFDPQWIPESQVPVEPQKSPMMVIWEFNATLEDPKPEQQKAASDWIERCYESAQRHGWIDIHRGFADGYERLPMDPRHYPNHDYLADDRVLDPDRPEFLMYYPKADGSKALAGFMFVTRNLVEKGPQFAGPLTVWHYHVWSDARCVFDGVHTIGFAHHGGTCERGEPNHRSLEMLHTWLIDHPQGPFATSMVLPPEVVAAGLEKRLEERGF
jgi:hypothetical protein